MLTCRHQSKLILLKSVSKFLRMSLTPDHIHERDPSPGSTDWSEGPSWYFASSFQTQTSFQSFTSLTIPTRTVTDQRQGDIFQWTPKALDDPGLSNEERSFGPFNFPLIDATSLGEWSLDTIESSCTANLKAESHEGNAVEVSGWPQMCPAHLIVSFRSSFLGYILPSCQHGSMWHLQYSLQACELHLNQSM